VATIKDVARLANVGAATASRVVSGKGSVSPATLERVKKAIEQLDYRPSHAARSLLSGSSKMIGVYIPALKGTFFAPILSAIDMVLREVGLNTVVAFGSGAGDGRRQAIDGIEFLLARGCDGIIVMTGALSDEDILAFVKKESRMVVMNQHLNGIPDQCFAIDHRHGGVLAARAFLEHGHRRIAIIKGPSTSPDNVERVDGFLSELAANGIDVSGIWMTERDFAIEGGLDGARELLASGYKFTALFCANDEMAAGAISHFHVSGIAVPRDVSVVGYDDTPLAEFLAPPLTTVHIPWREVVISAVNALLNHCYHLRRPVERRFPISMTYRDSLAKAPDLGPAEA
jgi:LacI family transcriptional regulator